MSSTPTYTNTASNRNVTQNKQSQISGTENSFSLSERFSTESVTVPVTVAPITPNTPQTNNNNNKINLHNNI